MFIQVHTDHHLRGGAEMKEEVISVVEPALSRFSSRITDLEVHLSDQNGEKGGEKDMRCAMEARLAGLPPLGVSHSDNSLSEAIEGAAERLERLIEHHLGKIAARH
ncbi:HPF/RaiA family ribosome-associated protein [Luteolibacter flavescens]|uniref:HPF/RaiA family ribosome-associated protein n=1 Tax=Luteolibacter flavescens TaxID=1859460 RepID=A0ABT3FR72_9BACT|nr:HPF/RaiA family ribosome-associated protein [Luteolibacter flavescens]MCW1886052.1 HPF/RaiA family ribosome-associated protein [Luteolibacter flavescens]